MRYSSCGFGQRKHFAKSVDESVVQFERWQHICQVQAKKSDIRLQLFNFGKTFKRPLLLKVESTCRYFGTPGGSSMSVHTFLVGESAAQHKH